MVLLIALHYFLKIQFFNLDKIIKIIRSSKNPEIAKLTLLKTINPKSNEIVSLEFFLNERFKIYFWLTSWSDFIILKRFS